MNLDFDRFVIKGSDGLVYQGIRPSLIPKPFKSVIYKYKDEKNLTPVIPTIKNTFLFLGFDACFVVRLIGLNESEVFIKFKTKYQESENVYDYVSIFTQEGKLVKEFWEKN